MLTAQEMVRRILLEALTVRGHGLSFWPTYLISAITITLRGLLLMPLLLISIFGQVLAVRLSLWRAGIVLQEILQLEIIVL